MCRAKTEAKTEADRRCDCDTSEKRRLRRHSRDAIVRNAPLALKPSAPNFIPSPPPNEVQKERFTADSVSEEIESISDGMEELQELGESADAIFAFVDRKLHIIGAGIDYISENKYGAPTDADFVSAYESFKKPFLQYKAEALAAGKDEATAEEEASDKLWPDCEKLMTQLFEKRTTAIKKALIDVGVEFADPETLKYTRNSDKEAVKALKKAVSFYPQSWVDNSNSHKLPLHVKSVKDGERAGYKTNISKLGVFNRKSEIAVAEVVSQDFAGGISVGLHEFAHRIEHANSTLVDLERAFLMRRSGHYSEAANPVKPEELSIIRERTDEPGAEDEDEYGYKDNFPEPYMGKVYEGHAFEIFSMGMETLFAGTNGGFAGVEKYKADPDYKRFILGTLASTAIKNY